MALRGMNKLDSGAPDRRQKHAGMTMAEYNPTKTAQDSQYIEVDSWLSCGVLRFAVWLASCVVLWGMWVGAAWVVWGEWAIEKSKSQFLLNPRCRSQGEHRL